MALKLRKELENDSTQWLFRSFTNNFLLSKLEYDGGVFVECTTQSGSQAIEDPLGQDLKKPGEPPIWLWWVLGKAQTEQALQGWDSPKSPTELKADAPSHYLFIQIVFCSVTLLLSPPRCSHPTLTIPQPPPKPLSLFQTQYFFPNSQKHRLAKKKLFWKVFLPLACSKLDISLKKTFCKPCPPERILISKSREGMAVPCG